MCRNFPSGEWAALVLSAGIALKLTDSLFCRCYQHSQSDGRARQRLMKRAMIREKRSHENSLPGREVRKVLIVQRVVRIGTLSCFPARCAKRLICLFYSAARPPGTSRLLSCHTSVGGRLPAVPARLFAKLRSHKVRTNRLGSSFAAGSLHMTCRVFGRRTWRRVSPDRQNPGRGSGGSCVGSLQIGRGKATRRSTLHSARTPI
jgi:hypothetical protein